MNPERWSQIDSLLDAALDHAPEARTAFLREACPEDEELRGEVESLLVAHGQSGTSSKRRCWTWRRGSSPKAPKRGAEV
jgi:hypothetical protein